MPSLITKKFNQKTIKNLLDTAELPDGTNNLFVFTGNSTTWSTGTAPAPTDTVESNYDYWSSMIALKRLTATDNIRQVIPNVTWATGTVYQSYDISNACYVLADDVNYRVYKCIDNNSNAESTVMPTGVLTTTFKTSDGYTWKYMYTVAIADYRDFLSSNWIPVQTLTADDSGTHGSQWQVQSSATDGAIEFAKIVSAGAGYNNIIVNSDLEVTPSITLYLSNGSSLTNDLYKNATVYMTNGTSFESRLITSYRAAASGTLSAKTATLNSAFSSSVTALNGASEYRYSVLPTININGDGNGAILEPTVSVTTGAITDITIRSTGTGYHFASPSITGCGGTGASVTVKISPPGGHGSDAVSELNCQAAMVLAKLEHSDTNFLNSNDYRRIGLISNVCPSGTTAIANSSFTTFRAYKTIVTSNESGVLSEDEVFYQTTVSETSALTAKGIVLSHSLTTHHLKFFQNTSTGFVPFSTTTGTTSVTGLGVTSAKTFSIGSYTAPDVSLFSGDILYVENRSAVERLQDEGSEIFKIIIKF